MKMSLKKGSFAFFLGILNSLLIAQNRRTCTECDTIFSTEPMVARQLFSTNNATLRLDSLQRIQAIELCASAENRKLRFEGLVEAEPFPPFALIDLNQKEIRLPDFNGKIVHIEFWATWSPAALHHLRQMQPVIQANSDTSIIYLFIAVDKNFNRWRNVVTANQFGGFHVLDQHQLIAMYSQIQAIPNYLLLDKKGRVVLNSIQESNWEAKLKALRSD